MPGSDQKRLARLSRALQARNEVSLRQVWSILTLDERAIALTRWLDAARSESESELRRQRQALASEVSSALKGFRPATVLSWPIARLCAEAAKVAAPESRVILEAVVLQHHFPLLADLQGPLLNALGIEHNDGMIKGTVREALHGLAATDIEAGGREVWAAKPSPAMALYLYALVAMYPEEWGALADLLPDIGKEILGNGSSPGDAKPLSDSVDSDGEGSQDPATLAPTGEWRAVAMPVPTSEDAGLSALDNDMILRVVASVQGITDAPDEPTMDAVLDELVHLSVSRHQSFFHLGLHDAMRWRAYRETLPAANRSRFRWYLTGYLSGLRRRDALIEMRDLIDELEEVFGLGDTGMGPSRLAAPIIVGVLIQFDRASDLQRFATPPMLRRMPQVCREILDYATQLARQERFGDALPLLEGLWNVWTADPSVDPSFRASLSRRLAQCYREQDQLGAARDLLLGVVEHEDDGHRAMALSDLGLIEAGLRRLADLKLPNSKEEAAGMTAALRRGWDRFEEALTLDVATVSHARYCMGMAELANGEYANAEEHLEAAVCEFDQEQSRYKPWGLLDQAHFHLAVARCLNLDSNALRLERAAHAIAGELRKGRALPDWYARDVIDALSMREGQSTMILVEQLLEAGGGRLLDVLRDDSKARHSAVVAEAFATRASAENRTLNQRALDGSSALSMFLAQANYDQARAALDLLEDLAVREGGESALFREVLATDRNITALWDQEDIDESLLRLYESANEYHLAAEQVVKRVHRLIAGARPDAYARVADLLDRLESYPNHAEAGLPDLRRRLELSGLQQEMLPAPPSRAVSVLVVGGNETQKQYDGPIAAYYKEQVNWLSVEFMHTGWSSNWGPYVDEFKRRIEDVDAVVFIYLMRTELGRALRRACGAKPWRGCGGKGRLSIQRAIDAAAAAAVEVRGQ